MKDTAPNALRILLVEDDEDDYLIARTYLAEPVARGMELCRVNRLEEGLARLAQGGIDAVLLDLSLPDCRGLETFRRVRAQAPQVPVVLLTGLDDEAVGMCAVQQGAQDYLVKSSVSAPLLVRALRYAIERKRVEDELERYAVQLRRRNAQMADDVNMARDIQYALLPQKYPAFPPTAPPAESRIRFCHRYRPSAPMGGDFFSVLALGDGRAGVFICDVMGHGMRAALITAILRGLIEELKPVADRPGEFLTALNRGLTAILTQSEELIFVSAAYLTADADSGRLCHACAGHPRPMHIRPSTAAVTPLGGDAGGVGPVLGIMAEHEYATGVAAVEPGDAVLFFTDGLYEVEAAGGGAYGEERLLAAVRRRAAEPLPRMIDALMAEVEAFAAGAGLADDICVVGMELAAAGGRVGGPAAGGETQS